MPLKPSALMTINDAEGIMTAKRNDGHVSDQMTNDYRGLINIMTIKLYALCAFPTGSPL
jgi:hypothetical protein